jgi:hypothetical protein
VRPIVASASRAGTITLRAGLPAKVFGVVELDAWLH